MKRVRKKEKQLMIRRLHFINNILNVISLELFACSQIVTAIAAYAVIDTTVGMTPEKISSFANTCIVNTLLWSVFFTGITILNYYFYKKEKINFLYAISVVGVLYILFAIYGIYTLFV